MKTGALGAGSLWLVVWFWISKAFRQTTNRRVVVVATPKGELPQLNSARLALVLWQVFWFAITLPKHLPEQLRVWLSIQHPFLWSIPGRPRAVACLFL